MVTFSPEVEFHNDGGGFHYQPPPRSLWTKYCLLCTLCGGASTVLGAHFLFLFFLFRYYTTSLHYFETVPSYLPAILLSTAGVSTIAFSWKRNRKLILLRITAVWSLLSAALSSVITITTTLVHMNRVQTLKECVYQSPSCSCYSSVFTPPEGVTYVFENTPDCEVIHGVLYSCLRAVFGHERKKAYWSRIRRINSDWSADFIACLPPSGGPASRAPTSWGPPPPYEEEPTTQQQRSFPFIRLSHSEHSFIGSPHPFSPTITSLNPLPLLMPPQTGGHTAPAQGPLRLLSMSSITSFSIPGDTLKSLSTGAELEELEEEANNEENTCKCVSGSVFEEDLPEDPPPHNLDPTAGRKRWWNKKMKQGGLISSLPGTPILGGGGGGRSKTRPSSNFRIPSSLPCSPYRKSHKDHLLTEPEED